MPLNGHPADTDSDFILQQPIRIEAADNQWWLMIKVPKALALSQANTISQQLGSLLQATQQQQLVAIVVITLVALGLLVWFIQTITAPSPSSAATSPTSPAMRAT